MDIRRIDVYIHTATSANKVRQTQIVHGVVQRLLCNFYTKVPGPAVTSMLLCVYWRLQYAIKHSQDLVSSL